jgi:hypothetical protein
MQWDIGIVKADSRAKKHPRVREFMKNPDNYTLDKKGINRSVGAKLKDQGYLPRIPALKVRPQNRERADPYYRQRTNAFKYIILTHLY